MHQHTACSPIARERADFGLRLNEGCCMSNGIEEFPTQSATLLFVPADGGVKLFPCCFEISLPVLNPGIPAKLVQPDRLPAGINVRLPRKFIPFLSPEPSESR